MNVEWVIVLGNANCCCQQPKIVLFSVYTGRMNSNRNGFTNEQLTSIIMFLEKPAEQYYSGGWQEL